MRTVIRFIIPLVSLISIGRIAIAQVFLPFPEGLGLEIGGGHNQLLWRVNPDPPLQEEGSYDRQKLSFTPTVRLSYQMQPFESIALVPFVGYNRVGGKSSVWSSGYEDRFWFDALELGGFLTWQTGVFAIGPGAKYSHYFKKTVFYFDSFLETGPRHWKEVPEEIFFKNESSDLGIRLSMLFSHWSFSAESWFGIVRLERDDLDKYLDLRENHFRLLVGYRL
jgi:hypothetical protein